MPRFSLARQRRWFGWGIFGLAALTIYTKFFWNGIPVIWGPSASAAEMAAGREIFEHEWSLNDPLAHGDGLGPVFNARSCAACHFQGGLGGGGEMQHNVLAYEVLPRPGDPTFLTGTVHNFSVNADQQESVRLLNRLYPELSSEAIRVAMPNCPSNIASFDPVRTESIQSTALFGAGWIDLISEKAIRHNQRKRLAKSTIRELNLEFEQVPVGRLRTLANGRVGRFGWKAQFASLEEFVASACANELGLGTPKVAQAQPLGGPVQSVKADLDKKQFRSLVAFVKTLPKPVETESNNPSEQILAPRGKELFHSTGCAICHVPDLGGVQGIYSDFLLYSLTDPPPPGGGQGGFSGYGPEPPPQLQLPPRPENDPKPSEWKTPALWGVADSAPYLHDGTAPTLRDAILRHHGDARLVTEAFQKLGEEDQKALVAFLKTLRAPPDALPLRDASMTNLARK